MTPAVINIDLARETEYDVVLLVQDAAAVPLDLTGSVLDLALKAGDAAVPLAVDTVDAAGGHVRVRVPGLPLGMYSWEGWLQLSPETPRERIIRGLVTVADKVDPRAEGNPSTHRYMVRISDSVTVTVDAVDLAWWAYEQTRKLLGVDYAALCADAARTSQQASSAAHASSVNAAASSVEAMRHKDAAGLSATGAATSERNADASAQAAADAARTASDAQGAAAEDAQELRRLLGGFTLTPGRVDSLPHGNNPSVSIDPGPTPGSHVLNFVLISGPQGPKGDPGTLAANAGDLDLGGHLTATGGTFAGTVNANGGVRSTAVLSGLEDMMTLGGGYAARAFDLSGYVDLRGMQFATAVNVNKLHHPYLIDKDLVVFNEVPAGNNFLSYPVIKFDRYWVAWGTFPPSSLVLSNGGTYVNYEAGNHNAYMGFAFGQSSMAAQSVSDVTPPYIYLKMYSIGRSRTTFTLYYNTGDGEHVIERDGLTRSINRLYLIYEQLDVTSARISVGVVYGTSNLGVTSRQVTIYRMGVIAIDYYNAVEKVIPFFSNDTTIGSISTMQRALGLSVHPGMLITDYFTSI